jgi:hypothetical protein
MLDGLLTHFTSPAISQSQTRIATILTLLDEQSTSIVHVANTHWDDQGRKARHESGKLLRQIVPEAARKAEHKLGKGDGKKLAGVVLLMGDLSQCFVSVRDFRASRPMPDDPCLLSSPHVDSPADEAGFQALTSSLSSHPRLTPPFHHLPTLLPISRHAFGPKHTYTGFYPSERQTEIDFVFLYDESVEAGWSAERYGVVEPGLDVREQEGQGLWRGRLSDHRFVGGEVVWRGET